MQAYYAGSGAVAHGLSSTEKHTLRERLTPDARGIVLVMVGLPARGKSFISRRTERFLQWRGIRTRMFNVGKYRRDALDPQCSGRSDFFAADNKQALQVRETAAIAALEDAISFLDAHGSIAILDATNSTVARRRKIVEYVEAHQRGYRVLFVEAICNDAQVLDANMWGKVSNSPDFSGLEPAAALSDLRKRIAKYEEVYETVGDEEGSFIKLFNLSSKVMVNQCYGRMTKTVLPYLMAIHIGARPIWLVRAGPGPINSCDGAASERSGVLSNAGWTFASNLAAFVKKRAESFWQEAGKPQEPTHFVTGTWPRAIASVCYATDSSEQASALNPIDKGSMGSGWWSAECDRDMPPWEEIGKHHPEFFEQWRKDPLRVRFPGGESYMDVIKRLEGLLIEVEMCTRPVLLVSHLTVLQLLMAYFRDIPVEEAWKLPVPKGTVIEVTPLSGGGFKVDEHTIFSSQEQISDATGGDEGAAKRRRISNLPGEFDTPPAILVA
mmetsp:Transcript_77202/g.136751  ORF Transcript_77202/g.136751 Transcript_77202/m.136751 type:complete len:496 (+) Transcript_77202:43-1530(+)